MAGKWIEKVFEVKRVSDRIILVKIIVGQRVLCLLSVYASQCGLSDSVKDLFYDQLRAVTAIRVATISEKVLENEKFSRSGKSQGITFSVREI